jgi:hypothetical protein
VPICLKMNNYRLHMLCMHIVSDKQGSGLPVSYEVACTGQDWHNMVYMYMEVLHVARVY